MRSSALLRTSGSPAPTAARTAELARRIAACSYEVEFAAETAARRAGAVAAEPVGVARHRGRPFRARRGRGRLPRRPTPRSTARRSPRSSSRPTTSGVSGCPSSPGPPPQNKGMALFPRRVDGRYLALSRWDRENNSIAVLTGRHAGGARPRTLQTPSRPWELLQIGNCGSPIETEAGWLVLTHGVGPMREYCHRRPAARPGRSEPGHRRAARAAPGARRGRRATATSPTSSTPAARCGTAISCCCPTGRATRPSGSPSWPAAAHRSVDRRRTTRRDAGEQLRVVRHHPRRGEALLDVVTAMPSRQRGDLTDRRDRAREVVDEEAGPTGPDDLGHRPAAGRRSPASRSPTIRRRRGRTARRSR